MKKILLLVLSVVLSTTTYAGTIRPDIDEQKYLDFGKDFFCVRQLVTIKEKENEPSFGLASCVILNEHWCITAAHITEDDFDVVKVIIGDRAYCLDKIIVPREFNPAEKRGDIALGFCEKGFGEVKKPKLYEDKIKVGQVCSIAGFGKYGNMESGAKIVDGKLRAGSNKISYRYNDMVMCEASKENPTVLEFLPNVGDSGGGLFVQGKLAAITCLIFGKNGSANSKYGDEAGFVELYPYIEWIKDHVKKTEM